MRKLDKENKNIEHFYQKTVCIQNVKSFANLLIAINITKLSRAFGIWEQIKFGWLYLFYVCVCACLCRFGR